MSFEERKISPRLKLHLTVLQDAGLLSQKDKEQIDSYLALCKFERQTVEGKEGILNVLTYDLFEEMKILCALAMVIATQSKV